MPEHFGYAIDKRYLPVVLPFLLRPARDGVTLTDEDSFVATFGLILSGWQALQKKSIAQAALAGFSNPSPHRATQATHTSAGGSPQNLPSPVTSDNRGQSQR